MSPKSLAAPVSQSERIVLIDSLRGFALLGILLMNIPYFALPPQMTENPMLKNELGTFNGKVWYWVEMIPTGTQRALFSMLFGAGMILFVTKLLKRLEGTLPVEYLLRRQLWLVVFGLFNAFVLLWPGDILFQYGIIGIIAFVFWRLPARGLVIASLVALVFMTARENRNLYMDKAVISKGEAIATMDTTQTKLTPGQEADLSAMTRLKEKSSLESQKKDMEKDIREIRGGYAQVYNNLSGVSEMIEFRYTYYGLWDVLIFMFLGMAFFKMGIITGQAPTSLYLIFCVVGLAAGLWLTNREIQLWSSHRFNFYEVTKDSYFSSHQFVRCLRSIGVFGLLMLLYKSGWFKWLFALMRPVGQMAFTNYLSQSLICAIIFYGIGFGLYGKMQRYQVYGVVAAIWVAQIIFSAVWLKFFRFGPLEWAWRSLTYWKLQPMKKEPAYQEPTSEGAPGKEPAPVLA